MAAAVAAGVLLLVYLVLRLLLSQTGEAAQTRLNALAPEERLRLSRGARELPPAAESAQASRLKQFLKPEIDQGLVTVVEDAQTVRVRTIVGKLFESGSDELLAERLSLFRRIAEAIEQERGSVTVEGHADSDPPSSRIAFPDNMALSEARAETVARLVRDALSDRGRVTARGLGETRPIESNATVAGKAANRRVEIIVPRVQ
jgi:type VI secretion system protein ImpK